MRVSGCVEGACPSVPVWTADGAGGSGGRNAASSGSREFGEKGAASCGYPPHARIDDISTLVFKKLSALGPIFVFLPPAVTPTQLRCTVNA